MILALIEKSHNRSEWSQLFVQIKAIQGFCFLFQGLQINALWFANLSNNENEQLRLIIRWLGKDVILVERNINSIFGYIHLDTNNRNRKTATFVSSGWFPVYFMSSSINFRRSINFSGFYTYKLLLWITCLCHIPLVWCMMCVLYISLFLVQSPRLHKSCILFSFCFYCPLSSVSMHVWRGSIIY